VLQTAGAHANEAFDPRRPELKYYKTGVEEQDLFCMTLVDCEGSVLWQTGTPWALDRPFSWNGHWSEFCDVRDLDGDGNIEIMFVHQDELRIYDGATGTLRRSRKLPNSAFYYARAVKTDHSGRYHIFTKSGSSSPTHGYGSPAVLLDHDLNTVWEREVPGAGHAGNFADIDGDGLDELLVGFTLFDHDGTELWSHAPLSEGDHLDDSLLADIDEDGRFEIGLAHDGHDAMIHNDDGTERFRVPMHHCQHVFAGDLLDDEPGLQLVFVDKPIGAAEEREAAVVDPQGRVLSRHPTLGYYSLVRWPTDLGPESFVRLERPVASDGEHRVLWADAFGRELAKFKVRASFYDRIKRYNLDSLPGQGRYFGRYHTPSIGDLDGDGKEELLITDRETVWVFRNE